MREHVFLEVARLFAGKVALCALEWFLPGVFPNVRSEGGKNSARIVALFALVWFLPTVNKGMLLQTTVPTKRLVTLCAIVFDHIMDCLVMGKTTCT